MEVRTKKKDMMFTFGLILLGKVKKTLSLPPSAKG